MVQGGGFACGTREIVITQAALDVMPLTDGDLSLICITP